MRINPVPVALHKGKFTIVVSEGSVARRVFCGEERSELFLDVPRGCVVSMLAKCSPVQ